MWLGRSQVDKTYPPSRSSGYRSLITVAGLTRNCLRGCARGDTAPPLSPGVDSAGRLSSRSSGHRTFLPGPSCASLSRSAATCDQGWRICAAITSSRVGPRDAPSRPGYGGQILPSSFIKMREDRRPEDDRRKSVAAVDEAYSSDQSGVRATRMASRWPSHFDCLPGPKCRAGALALSARQVPPPLADDVALTRDKRR
jgi:hypothetical protein